MLLVPLLIAQALPAPWKVVELKAELDHVQGIDTDGRRLWVSEVKRREKRGLLHEFELESGRHVRSLDLTRGEQYHPGGIALLGDSIWAPMAEYRRNSSATVVRVDLAAWQVVEEIPVADHIGAVAADRERLIGANWDARQIYDLRAGTKRDNPHPTRYQDMKLLDGVLVASGISAIDWLDPATLALKFRTTVGRTDRGVLYTQEGMAVRGRSLYLLPEDGPSRLFFFDLAQVGSAQVN
ncbi:MAG: DUF6454 family protein [Bryobacteraceae bacterium]|nr:DUF6454 family protein [Bryobacteraceae bacterium]